MDGQSAAYRQSRLPRPGRGALRAGWFVLRLEPENPRDANAVVVQLDCRKIGYLSRAKAVHSEVLAVTPFDGFEVDGRTDSPQVRVTLPGQSELRECANSETP